MRLEADPKRWVCPQQGGRRGQGNEGASHKALSDPPPLQRADVCECLGMPCCSLGSLYLFHRQTLQTTRPHSPSYRPQQHVAPDLPGPGYAEFRPKCANHALPGKWFSGQGFGLGGQGDERMRGTVCERASSVLGRMRLTSWLCLLLVCDPGKGFSEPQCAHL